MNETVHTERYRVMQGKRVHLDRWNPSETTGFDGDEDAAEEELGKLMHKLDQLQEMLYAEDKHSLLVVLQAMDTGGKDGTIRRVFQGVNPSGVRVAHFREPTPEELQHDFLWREHKDVPGRGELVIFNRSHYEGVLIERVHGLISQKACRRRYEQIIDFERLLSESGTTILKFYLNIDSDEQKRRLEERLADPTKRWKFSTQDLPERKLWPKYMKAFERALEMTSTDRAPWYIVPANHKWYRDLVVARVLVKALEGLDMQYPGLPKGMRSVTIV